MLRGTCFFSAPRMAFEMDARETALTLREKAGFFMLEFGIFRALTWQRLYGSQADALED